MRRRFVFLAGLVLVAAGCQSIFGFKDFRAGSGGSAGAAQAAGSGGAAGADAGDASGNGGAGADAGDASSDGGVGPGGSGDASGNPCVNAKAPAWTVPVRLSTGKCIWMDATEVKAGDYDKFAATAPDAGVYTASPCAWKKSFQAGCDPDAGTDAGFVDPKLPVTCVDWCDARAYCLSRGEQLCGQPGDPSWWVAACTSGGAGFTYPYGSTYDATACNGEDNTCNNPGGCALVDVGSMPKCRTPSGIYDLSGNAAEWVNECSGPANQYGTCQVRGGSALNAPKDVRCDATSPAAPMRNDRHPFRGFRCCWVP